MIVYAVVFMNYHPLEVDSLWSTREGAQVRIKELTVPSCWDIAEMEVHSQLPIKAIDNSEK